MTSHYENEFTNEHFLVRSYIVTFNYNDGRANVSFSFFYNEPYLYGAPPTRTGWRFGNWWDQAVGGSEWNFGNQLSGDITLYARWIGFPVIVLNPSPVVELEMFYNRTIPTRSISFNVPGTSTAGATGINISIDNPDFILENTFTSL
jgi:hypothetical protein